MLFLLLGSISLSAQNVYDDFAGVYAPYKFESSRVTPAPRGYEAFYISHIGRHGSRYAVDFPYVNKGLAPLLRADTLGILTPRGKKLLKDFVTLDSLSQGLYGFLCQRGYVEHEGIALRMAENYPQVFRGRDSILCQSTHIQRCIQSSWSFCIALKGAYPKLAFRQLAGEKYFAVLCNVKSPKLRRIVRSGAAMIEDYLNENFDLEGFFSSIFTDMNAAGRLNVKLSFLLECIFTNGAMARYLGVPTLSEFLTPEESEVVARAYNAKLFVNNCASAENGPARALSSAPLLEDVLSRADAAVAGNKIAADLRFTHDSGIMPYLSLIKLKGYEYAYSYDEARRCWDATELIPMGTNVQMIFFRNRSGRVLVKLLFNEKETSIPALGPGPYYDWGTLRAYMRQCTVENDKK